MSSGNAQRMFVLQYGAEHVTKALSLRGGSPRLYWEPLIGILVETANGWVLLDSGMGRQALETPATHQSYEASAGARDDAADPWHLYPRPPSDVGKWCWGLEGDPLTAALAHVGIAVGEISLAAVSHLHLDHSGGIPTLAQAGVPIAIHSDELEFARSGQVDLADGFHAPDWQASSTEWRSLTGDTELAPGVYALATPGHTPGHLSFRVDLDRSGTWIFAVDAADLAQNFLDRVPCGSVASATPEDEARASQSLDRLLDEAVAADAHLIPGHDQVVFNAIRHPTDGHR